MRCPFGYQVGEASGPWTCPPYERQGECYCLQACVLFAMGEVDDRIQHVIEFWRPIYDQADWPWVSTMPELPRFKFDGEH